MRVFLIGILLALVAVGADGIYQYISANHPSQREEKKDLSVARKQLKEKDFPAIKDNLPDLKKYKVIYLGFPTWWHQPPRIIHTFFRDYDVKRKVIVPFTTIMSDSILTLIVLLKRQR